jgi:hypothetical protein
MGIAYNPRIVTEGLRVAYDAGNIKSYPGSGNTLFSLNGRENATATTISTATDVTVGTVLNYNTSTAVTINLSPVVNHEVWSIMFWVRSTGLTSSNYRSVLILDDTNSSHNYFYLFDTRETTSSYILGYQKDYSINDWLTTSFNTDAQWAEQKWWCIGVSHNNTVFKSYRQGNLFQTQTQTRNVAGYGDINQLHLNQSGSNTVYMGPLLFYDRILTDDEFRQNFNATRGRFNI